MQKVLHDIQDFDGDDNSDDDNDKVDFKKFQKKYHGTLYLIDARKEMFESSDDERKPPFLRCLESVRNAIRSYIFKSEKCFCSVILLGTETSDNILKLNNITALSDFKLLEAEHVMKIDEIIKAVEDSSYERKYGHHSFSLGEALWLASHTHNQRSKHLNKSVILMTNDDNPVSSPNDLRRSISIAQDMFGSSIFFKLVPIGKDFDMDKLFKGILEAAQNDKNCTVPVPVTTSDEILKTLSEVRHKSVNLVRLPFSISDNFQIEVIVHYLVRKLKPPFKVKLSKSTNEKVVSKTQLFNEETGSLVRSDDVIKSQLLGLKDVFFRPKELKAIYSVGEVGLKLLGFKPASFVRLENFVKPCAFIYPDDSKYKGSSVFFTALLKRCIAKQVVPICTFCQKQNSTCRFVALIAQDEYLDSGKSQKSPPGFVVFFLPFAEELRPMDDIAINRAEPEQVGLARKLVKKLRFKYTPECFQNPKIQAHWAAIEALALDLKEPSEVNDSTLPNYDLISHRTGEIARNFLSAVYPDDYKPESFVRPKKPRKVESAEVNVENVEETVRSGNGERLSVDVLKSYLISVGQGRGLSKVRKTDLLERVRKHLGLD